MLELLFNDEGHRTSGCRRWAEGVGAGRPRATVKPDIVIADYNLPDGLNGLETIAGLRSSSPRNSGHHPHRRYLDRQLAQDRPRLRASQQAGQRRGADAPRRAPSCQADTQSSPSARAVTATAVWRGPHPSTIFVIDDDPALRATMRDLLQDGRVGARRFAVGPAFFETYRPGQKVAVLVDAQMQGMGGLALLERLKAEETSWRPS